MRTLRARGAAVTPLVPAVLFAVAVSVPVAARTFCFPHLLEQTGRISSTSNTFDTEIYMTYSPGWGMSPPGTGATMQLYLFGEDGSLATNSVGAAVCAPCVFDVGPLNPAQTISIEDDLYGPGELPPAGPVELFATAEVTGDEDNLVVLGRTANTNDPPSRASYVPYLPVDLIPPGARGSTSRTFVIPHVLETAGMVPDAAGAVDVTLYVTYVGGLPGTGGSVNSSATLDVYLFDQGGAIMLGSDASPVCQPCSFPMGDGSISPRKRKISVEALFQPSGGLPAGQVPMVVYAEASGDAAHLGFRAEESRTHDLAGEVYPEALAAVELALEDAASSTPPVLPERTAKLSVAPNPAGATTRISFELTRPGRAELSIYDVSGRRVRALSSEVLAAGRYDRAWDGRNDDGRPVAGGVYFAQLRQDGAQSRAKITVGR